MEVHDNSYVMATRLGTKVKNSHSRKTPASAVDSVPVSEEISRPDRSGYRPSSREQDGDEEHSSSDEELDTRAMVEEKLRTFWERQNEKIANMTEEDVRATPDLPLARIKKIMKLDDNVKMISSEVPLLFSKAATVFIEELTLRAWLHTEEAKRKTLQKSDIAKALSEDEMYDFLIDIVPREDTNPSKSRSCPSKQNSSVPSDTGGEGGESQNLFLSEDQIRACMELLRKQIAQEEKLEESWKNEADIRPEVEVQLLIQQQLLQHQVLLQYLENILEAKEGDYPASSQELQAHISQLMGAARSGFMGCPPPGEGEEVADPHKMLEHLGELERQDLTSDPDLDENLLPPSTAPCSTQGQDQGYILPNNFNFSNNNLFLDGASLLSPLDNSENNPANHSVFSDKAFQIPSDAPISSALRLLDDSIEAQDIQ